MIKKILHCDDDPFVLELVQMSLELHDIECVSFTLGEALIKAIDEHSPDVVLLDRQMLPMTGPEIAGTMSRQCPEIPVIFMSGETSFDHSYPDNIAGEILKPFDVDTFLEQIIKLVDTYVNRVRVGSSPESSVEIDELRVRYLQSLGPQVNKLSEAMHGYITSQERSYLDATARMCHRIVGTSGMYGFNRVSSAAADLQRRVDALCSREHIPSQDELDKLSLILSQLESIVESVVDPVVKKAN